MLSTFPVFSGLLLSVCFPEVCGQESAIAATIQAQAQKLGVMS